jgi:antitoxin VapB
MADPKRGVAETARVFSHEGGTAVDLPEGYGVEGEELRIRREGDRIILEPTRPRRRTQAEMDAFWARIDALGDPDDPFPDPPPQTITPIKTW